MPYIQMSVLSKNKMTSANLRRMLGRTPPALSILPNTCNVMWRYGTKEDLVFSRQGCIIPQSSSSPCIINISKPYLPKLALSCLQPVTLIAPSPSRPSPFAAVKPTLRKIGIESIVLTLNLKPSLLAPTRCSRMSPGSMASRSKESKVT